MTDQTRSDGVRDEEELPEIDPDTLEPIRSKEDDLPEITPILHQADEPLTLIDDDPSEQTTSKIQAIGQGALHAAATQFKRPVNVTGAGATRCRIFHSKISPVPMEYLEKLINEWIDSSDIEVKFVSQSVGMLEGKRAEPALIVSVWY
ncbi:MAG: hypothetical protein GX591_17580 [Planctomycetes bacterium]|nr:hypothetical protein [Planctomycetota bacterium]